MSINWQSGLGSAAAGAGIGTAIAPGIGTAIGAGLGGLVGLFAPSGDDEREKQTQVLEQIQKEIDAVPDPQLKQVILEKYKSAGLLTPEMETVVNLGPSRMEGLSTDPRLKNAQMQALQKLQQVGAEGLTAEDRAVLNDVRRSVANQEQAREQSILQGMRERGVGGSGSELAAQLASSQAAGEQQSKSAENQAAVAQQRALQAIMQRGTMAGQMQGQEFNQKAQIANAADAIAKFNAANQQNVQNANVGARNLAQTQNLANAQAILNANTGITNQNLQQPNTLAQQAYENRLKKLGYKTGAMTNQATNYGNQAASKDAAGGAMTSGLATTGLGVAQTLQAQQRDKDWQDLYRKKNKLDSSGSGGSSVGGGGAGDGASYGSGEV